MIAALFIIPVFINRKDSYKLITCISFLVVYILGAGHSFEGENFIYFNMLLSASLLISPTTGRDWSTILLILIVGFIGSDFIAINYMENCELLSMIDNFKYASTITVLVVLVFMSKGTLDGYAINNRRLRIQHHIRGLFRSPNPSSRLQRD